MRALSAPDYIFEGRWTNWRKGPVFGQTLTVSPEHAQLLSPALAVLISVAGAQLWRLFQVMLHQSRATDTESGFLYHQQQVVLRNTTTILNTLWRLTQLHVAWRHHHNIHALQQTAPLVALTLLVLFLVISAGLFSSRVLQAGDEVLSRSPWCGWWNETYLDAISSNSVLSDEVARQALEWGNNLNSIYSSIQQYVDICSTSLESCGTLPADKLNFTWEEAPGQCPFSKSLCHPKVDGSIKFDTGYLSSSADLGLNTPRPDRIAFRLTAQCSPLHDADHVTNWTDISTTPIYPQYEISDAFYGRGRTADRDSTYSTIKQYQTCEQSMITPPYALRAEYAKAGGSVNRGSATFDPIEGLQMTDSALSLIMLTFNGAYEGRVLDPWFSAQTTINNTNAYCLGENKTLYVQDLPITTIGCVQQLELCDMDATSHLDKTSCTPPLSLSQAQALIANTSTSPVTFTPGQQAVINRLFRAAGGATFYHVIDKLSQTNTAPLQARHMSLPVPETQWQVETKYWFILVLAYLQHITLQMSTGQFAASTDYINVTRDSDFDKVAHAEYQLCQNQIILSRTYRSFNFFALVLTTVMSVLIIILGLLVEDLMGWIRQHRFRYTGYRQDMWISNGDLEMQKTISELKQGTVWTRCKNGIPVAGPGYRASMYDLMSSPSEVDRQGGVVHERRRVGLEQHRRGASNDILGVLGNLCASCSAHGHARAASDEQIQMVANMSGPTPPQTTLHPPTIYHEQEPDAISSATRADVFPTLRRTRGFRVPNSSSPEPHHSGSYDTPDMMHANDVPADAGLTRMVPNPEISELDITAPMLQYNSPNQHSHFDYAEARPWRRIPWYRPVSWDSVTSRFSGLWSTTHPR